MILKKGLNKLSEKPSSNWVFFLLLIIISVSSFYAFYMLRLKEKAPAMLSYAGSGTHSEPYPEFAEEIQEVLGLVSKGDTDAGRRKFADISERIYGGSDWVLLKLSLLENTTKTYNPLENAEKPLAEISARPDKNGSVMVTVKIINRDSEFMNLPKVPSEFAWTLTGPGTDEASETIEGDCTLFGDPEKEEILSLKRNAFWGITIPLDPGKMNMGFGEWSIRLILNYTETELQGLNVISGKIRSNTVKVVL